MSYSNVEGDRIPMAREGELYSLKWHTFQSHLTTGLKEFLIDGDGDFLTDVTLVAEGQAIRSHRMLLSLCSPHFKQLFQQGHHGPNTNTIVILNNVRFLDLQNVIQFIYNGEVKVSDNHELQGFLQTGELLQIEGLTKAKSETEVQPQEPHQKGRTSPPAPAQPSHSRSHDHHGTLAQRRSQVPNKGSTVTTRQGSQQSQNVSIDHISSQHQPILSHIPTKRSRMMPTATVTSGVEYESSGAINNSTNVKEDLGNISTEMGGQMTIDPLAISGVGAVSVTEDPLGTGDGQGPEDERMIAIDGIKSEAGMAEIYGERDEEEEGTFEMTDHGDVEGLDDMEDVYGGDNMNMAGPSAISTGASNSSGAQHKPPDSDPVYHTLTPVPLMDNQPTTDILAHVPLFSATTDERLVFNYHRNYDGIGIKAFQPLIVTPPPPDIKPIVPFPTIIDAPATANSTPLNKRKRQKRACDPSGPLKCEVCGKYSKNKNSLKTHRSIYHRIKGNSNKEETGNKSQNSGDDYDENSQTSTNS